MSNKFPGSGTIFRFLLVPVFVYACVMHNVPSVYGAVLINEVSTASSSDWVELYNNASESASLTGYVLKDSGTYDNSLSDEGSIEANGFKVIPMGQYLNNGGDSVLLMSPSGETLQSISYGQNQPLCAPQGSQSLGRYPDGNSSFTILSSQTRESSNNASTPVSCPTPTPTVTLTSTPTQTPTATPKPTATPSPTNSQTPTPSQAGVASTVLSSPTRRPTSTKTITKTPTMEEDYDDGETSWDSTVLGDESSSPAALLAASDSQPKPNLKPLIISLLMTGIGVALLSFVFVLKNVYKRNHAGEE